MRILTYKRTHVGDPDASGKFGINDCMGRVRNWDFDAVIGVGGTGVEPRANGIDCRVTWVGLGPTWSPHPQGYGVVVTFDHFRLLDGEGPSLQTLAPLLARRMYEGKARVLLKSYSSAEKAEAEALIQAVLSLSSVSESASHVRKLRCNNRRARKACIQQPDYSPSRAQTGCAGRATDFER